MNGNEILPQVFGCEQETMLEEGMQEADYWTYYEPKHFIREHEWYIPKNIRFTTGSRQHYLQNGGMVYDGGYDYTHDGTDYSLTILEFATPECSTLAEINAALQASELLSVKMGSAYVEQCSKDVPTYLRMQRRVVDSVGNTRGQHDNFSIDTLSQYNNFPDSRKEAALLAHLATRSFITGAGYVTKDGLRFAQKVEGISGINSYTFANTAYRIAGDKDEDTGARFEIRCNDLNISPWATRQRIGTMSLFLAALKTPIIEQLHNHTEKIGLHRFDPLESFKIHNMALVDENGELRRYTAVARALNFQEKMYEIFAEELGKYTELTGEYKDVIDEGIRYCDDFRMVTGGLKSIVELRDRSDFAAKLKRIQHSVIRSRDDGFDREFTDIISQYWDLKYDAIEISPGTGNRARVEYGYGLRNRQAGNFLHTPSADSVETALYQPPKTTRAYVRGNLIKKGLVKNAAWDEVEIDDPRGSLSDLNNLAVRFTEPKLPADTPTDVIAYTKQSSLNTNS